MEQVVLDVGNSVELVWTQFKDVLKLSDVIYIHTHNPVQHQFSSIMDNNSIMNE